MSMTSNIEQTSGNIGKNQQMSFATVNKRIQKIVWLYLTIL